MQGLEQFKSSTRKAQLESGLAGYFFSQQNNAQLQKNILLHFHLQQIIQKAREHNLKPVVLKGLALLDSVYSRWGERPISDIDLLIGKTQHKQFAALLTDQGYTQLVTPRSTLSGFKTLWLKDRESLQVVVEVHTRLFWQEPKGFRWPLQKSKKGYHILSPSYFLLHLIGHYGFQHTFLKAFWLIDIVKFLDLYSAKLDWEEFYRAARLLRLESSAHAVFYLCERYFQVSGLKFKKLWWFNLLSRKFLLAPKKYPFRYLLLKHLVKGSLFTNLQYNIRWICSKLLLFKRLPSRTSN